MAIQILSNLNYPIGNIINQELQNANSAKMAVAFLKYSTDVVFHPKIYLFEKGYETKGYGVCTTENNLRKSRKLGARKKFNLQNGYFP